MGPEAGVGDGTRTLLDVALRLPPVRHAVGTALLGLALVLSATRPASAHALLIRTDPSPQTTVPRPPAAVRLVYSEPVEAAFGAVRVFDVDGRRVDSARLSRADGGREVDVAVPHLRDGTYTVTWRVVSADGHPVHGGFSFYVGTPSTISPAAVRAERGAGRAVGWAFGAVRFLWFAALLALVGAVVVRRWVWTPAVRGSGLVDSAAASVFRRRFAVMVPVAWAVLAVSGAASVVFEAATVSGLGFMSSARPGVVSEVLATAYGHWWTASIVLTVLAAVPAYALARRPTLLGAGPDAWIAALVAVTAGLAATAALNGHARTLGHPLVAVASVALHLMAVAVWVGGLATLVMLGGAAWRTLEPDLARALLAALIPRFSRVALVAAGLVVVTGAVNAFVALASVSDLWRTAYGRVLAAKIALLVLALGLAARHLLVVPGRMRGGAHSGRVVRSFGRSSAAELVAVVAAVALTAGLVALVPGRSLARAAKGPVNLEHRIGPDVVQFFLDPSTVGDNQVHLTYVSGQGLTDAGVDRASAVVRGPGGAAVPVELRLISPGHFVGDASLDSPGSYRLVVGPTQSLPGTTFAFRLTRPGAKGRARPR